MIEDLRKPMDQKDLLGKGFTSEGVALLESFRKVLRIREEGILRDVASAKREGTAFVSSYDFEHSVSGTLSEDDAWAEFEKFYNPPNASTDLQRIRSQARQTVLREFQFQWIDIAPYPVIDFTEMEIRGKKFKYKSSPVDKHIILVRDMDKKDGQWVPRERLSAMRPERLRLRLEEEMKASVPPKP